MNDFNLPGLIVPGYIAGDRPIRLGVPFFLTMDVEFSDPGVADENVTGQTNNNVNADILVHARTTDLIAAKVQFELPGTNPNLWSLSAVSIRSLFEQTGSARPYHRMPYPLLLPLGRYLSASTIINAGAEGPGKLVFLCSQDRTQQPAGYGGRAVAGLSQAKDGGWLLDQKRLGPEQVIAVNTQFTGRASEQTSSDGILSPVDYDFLLTGLTSDLAISTIQIIDVEGRRWCPNLTVGGANLCPIWAIAGTPNAQMWTNYLPLPYLIPANRMPTFNFQNDANAPEGGGGAPTPQVYMIGHRLLSL